jgi:hypothetical protein
MNIARAGLLFAFAAVVTAAAEAPGPRPGERIPAFSLPDQAGQLQSFESIRGARGAVLVFFRSADW